MSAPGLGRPELSITDAAAATKRDRRTIRRWLDAGRFPNARRTAAGDWRIPADDLLAAGLKLHAPTAPAVEQQPPVPAVEALRSERDEWRRRAEVAEAVAAERAEALADARLALRALTSSESPRAHEPVVEVERERHSQLGVPAPDELVVEQPRRRRWGRRR